MSLYGWRNCGGSDCFSNDYSILCVVSYLGNRFKSEMVRFDPGDLLSWRILMYYLFFLFLRTSGLWFSGFIPELDLNSQDDRPGLKTCI